METKQKFSSHAGYGKVLVASLFILCGVLLFARNMGWISYSLFDVLVSWQSLLIIIGIYTLAHRHYISGAIILLTGAYFFLGDLWWLQGNAKEMIWPLALILGGILFLAQSSRKARLKKQYAQGGHSFSPHTSARQCECDNGFLHSDNSFGAVRHVVLDELFKGACIRNSFGGTTIDLRHTHLAPGETYIDIECSCGGVELFIPADWKVTIKCSAFFGGCEDKRWQGAGTNRESVLVIRGNISFGGLEIKD